ncbi:hypothetical protein RB195_021005 [Necator americanus]|uniref:Uncharacterized protein n=1 Tax=Necator americanus TaxID=51031 RepID=A0ABR1CQ27_NECAM
MPKDSHVLQKDTVVLDITKAHKLQGQLPGGRWNHWQQPFVTLNCRALSSELQQAALSRLLRYLYKLFAALQETRMRDQH